MPEPTLRLGIALSLALAAVAAAVALVLAHPGKFSCTRSNNPFDRSACVAGTEIRSGRPEWVYAAAVAIALGGVAVSAGAYRRMS
jgi:hypothetical protein